MPKTVVFDLDGTLVDTAPDLTASLNHCLAAVGEDPMPLALARPHAGHGARALLKAAYARSGREPVEVELVEQTERFIAYYRENIAVGSKPFPGALAALERFADAGWRLAVCTNKRHALACRLLDALDLTARFQAVAGADTFARCKPDPLHLTETVAEAGGRPAEAVMIGDTATDIETATAAGVPAVLVAFGYGVETPARARAAAVIESFDDLECRSMEELTAAGVQAGSRGGG